MLIEHRGEAEYDFRHELHVAYRYAVTVDTEETLRLAKQLLKDPGTRLAAVVAGWDRPVSLEVMVSASLYSTWSGERHPLMPDVQERVLTAAETRIADIALEKMNRR